MVQTTNPTRENRTITVDFNDAGIYFDLLSDGKAFVEFILAFILSRGFLLIHKSICNGGGLTRHIMIGFAWAVSLSGAFSARLARRSSLCIVGQCGYATAFNGQLISPVTHSILLNQGHGFTFHAFRRGSPKSDCGTCP